MRFQSLAIGLESAIMLQALFPVAQGLPQWLQHHERKADDKAPRQYSVYETTHAYGSYTYAGYGPLPTVSSSAALSSASGNSGEETSSVDISSGSSISEPLPSASLSTSVLYSGVNSASLSTGYHESTITTSVVSSSDRSGEPTSQQTSPTLITNNLPSSSLAATSTTRPLKCNYDNCLRQLIRTSILAAPFCATYTTTISTGPTGLPSYVSHCKGSPSRISSACSCIGKTSVTPTAPSSVLPTVTSLPVSTSSNGEVVTTQSSSSDETITSRITTRLTSTSTIQSHDITLTTSGIFGTASSGIVESPSSSSVMYPNSTISTGPENSSTPSAGFSSSMLTSLAPYPVSNFTVSAGPTGTGPLATSAPTNSSVISNSSAGGGNATASASSGPTYTSFPSSSSAPYPIGNSSTPVGQTGTEPVTPPTGLSTSVGGTAPLPSKTKKHRTKHHHTKPTPPVYPTGTAANSSGIPGESSVLSSSSAPPYPANSTISSLPTSSNSLPPYPSGNSTSMSSLTGTVPYSTAVGEGESTTSSAAQSTSGSTVSGVILPPYQTLNSTSLPNCTGIPPSSPAISEGVSTSSVLESAPYPAGTGSFPASIVYPSTSTL